MQNIVERPQSLQDYLAEQLADLELAEDDKALAMHIISFVDRTGLHRPTEREGRASCRSRCWKSPRRSTRRPRRSGSSRCCIRSSSSTRRASRPATCASACCCRFNADTPHRDLVREDHPRPPRGHGPQPPAGDPQADRGRPGRHPGGDRGHQAPEPEAGQPVFRPRRPGTSRPT